MKWLKTLGLICISAMIGFLIGIFFKPQFSFFEKKQEESATIVLEKIKEVAKLVTVEGSLSELYSYQDFYSYDISPLRKKALVRINAKVSAGYDFDKMQINVNPAAKEIQIRNFPKAEILSVDHDLSYYDITEGIFNGFEKDDYNKINADVKKRITQAAMESGLLEQADKQKENLFEMLQILVLDSGYQLVISEVEESSSFLN